MFGYVKPYVPELKVKENTFYKSVYCGLCKCLGKNISCISRLSLSYDFVFLALVRAAVMNEPFEVGTGRCLLHPLKKRVIAKTNEAIAYSAAIGSLLTYYKVRDDLSDSKGLRKLGFAVALPSAKKMKKRANLPHELDAFIADTLYELSLCEKEKTASVDKPADIFGSLLAYITSYGVKDEIEELALYKIGYHIGKWIYIIDAADDYESDLKSGNYNPFVLSGGIDKDALFATLEAELKTLDNLIIKLDINDQGIKNIIINTITFGTCNIEKTVIYKIKPE